MKILFLSRWYPYPPNNGSKIRVLNLLKCLSGKHQTTLISFYNPEEGPPDVPGLQDYCESVKTISYREFNNSSPRAILGYLSPIPRSVLDTYSTEMQDVIVETIHAIQPDLVIASQFDMAVYKPLFTKIVSIFEELEVGVLYERTEHSKGYITGLRHWLTWYKHKKYLSHLCSSFDLSTVVSRREKELVVASVDHIKRLEVLPNFIDLDEYVGYHTASNSRRIIFTGSFTYEPNYEAMLWFQREVLPIIASQIPDVDLVVTGNPGGRSLPPSKNTRHVGFVEDVRNLVAGSAIAVVPLFTGGGTRLKILEAMALKTPVVSTTKGAEGLDVIDGQHLLLADKAKYFAESVLRLILEPNLRKQISDQAYHLVEGVYDRRVVAPIFLGFVQELLSGVNHD